MNAIKIILEVCFISSLGIFCGKLFAQEWQLFGLETEEIAAIAVDSSDENIIYAGISSDFSAGKVGGLFKSSNDGASWDTLIGGITAVDIDIHPFNSEIVYVTAAINSLTLPGIIKTMDGGMTWFHADSGILMYWEEGPMVLAIDPVYPDTLYVGTLGFFGGNLYKSVNGGNSWEVIGDTLMDWTGVSAIAIEPQNTNIVYVGTPDIGAVFKTTDGGETWDRLDFPEVGIVHDLLVHPDNSDIVYAGTWRYGFYFSTNGGATWQSANDGLSDTTSVRKVVISENQIYIAANNMRIGAVYESSIENIQWAVVGNQGFEKGVKVLSYLAEQTKLFLGTNGIYVYNIQMNVESQSEELPVVYRLLQNYPNPFNDETTIIYYLNKKAFVTLDVYDVSGRLTSVLVREIQNPGEYKVIFDAGDLASGIYFYRLRSGSYVKTRKLILIR